MFTPCRVALARISLAAQIGWLLACTAPPPPLQPVSSAPSLNDRLTAVGLASPAASHALDYRIGPGDVLEINVFQSEELSRSVRVRPDGAISFPLLGSLPVQGLTTAGLEAQLGRWLEKDYLHDPQVSVFIQEYRAHPVSVLGEVHQPGVRYMREPRRLLSMLSESGGLTEEAGTTVKVRRKEVRDGRQELVLFSIDLENLLASGNHELDLVLQDGDTVFVPKAGVVFVEGSVRTPGAYTLQGAGTVLKAVTLAGGFDFSAKESSVKLVRNGRSGPEVMEVDVKAAKRNPALDLAVQDGDVVIVSTDPVKIGLEGLWRGLTALVRVSTGL